jgi:hypothetical protein
MDSIKHNLGRLLQTQVCVSDEGIEIIKWDISKS